MDFELLDGIDANKTDPCTLQFLAAPVCLLYKNLANKIVPIAIQVGCPTLFSCRAAPPSAARARGDFLGGENLGLSGVPTVAQWRLRSSGALERRLDPRHGTVGSRCGVAATAM